jgi:parallel beta-helix repeat protein
MGMRPSTDYLAGYDPLVDRMIGKTFPAVKTVADSLDAVKYLTYNMEAIVEVAENLGNITEVLDSAAEAAAAATAADTSADAAATSAASAATQAAAAAASATEAAIGTTFTQTETGAVTRVLASKIRQDDPVSVLDFLTEGAINDQIAFERAFATGRPVMVPYRITPYILTSFVDLATGQEVFGIGRPTIRATGHGRIFRMNGVTGARVRGLILDGNKDGVTTRGGPVLMQNATNCVVEDCDILYASSTLFITSTSTGNAYRRCRFRDGFAGGVGLVGANVSRNTVQDCEFSWTGGFGVGLEQGAHRNLIIGNWCDRNQIELIGLNYSAHHNRIIGNHAEGCGDNGISITGWANVVTGNTSYKNRDHGIFVFGRENTVTGNSCISNGQVHNPEFWEYDPDGAAIRRSGIGIGASSGGTAQNNTICGNLCDDDQDVKTQDYGIRIDASNFSAWAAATSYTTGNIVRHGANVYRATAAGTSGTTAPTHTSGTVVVDGVSWEFVAVLNLGSAEPNGNFISGNRIYRYATAKFSDGTSSGNNAIYDDDHIDLWSQSPATNNVVGGFSRKVSLWTNGQSVGYGAFKFHSNNRVYQVTNAGGTCANPPTHTTGTVTGADGIAWAHIALSQRITSIDLTTADVRFGMPTAHAVTGTTTGFVMDFTGNGSPEGVVAAPVGSQYRRADGGAGTCLYVKESGTGTTGWVAK